MNLLRLRHISAALPRCRRPCIGRDRQIHLYASTTTPITIGTGQGKTPGLGTYDGCNFTVFAGGCVWGNVCKKDRQDPGYGHTILTVARMGRFLGGRNVSVERWRLVSWVLFAQVLEESRELEVHDSSGPGIVGGGGGSAPKTLQESGIVNSKTKTQFHDIWLSPGLAVTPSRGATRNRGPP